MKEQLEARLKELDELVRKYSADLNYVIGQKDEVIRTLNLLIELEKKNAD